jgi:hypothetical protein
VTTRYERICFDKEFVFLDDRPTAPMATRLQLDTLFVQSGFCDELSQSQARMEAL